MPLKTELSVDRVDGAHEGIALRHREGNKTSTKRSPSAADADDMGPERCGRRDAPMAETLSRRAILPSIPGAAIGTSALLPVAAAAVASPDAELIRLGAELAAAWAQEKPLWDAIGSSAEVEAPEVLWSEAEAASGVSSEIVDKIEGLRAHTLAGLQVKVAALSWTHNGEEFDSEFFGGDTTDNRLAAQIMRDLQALSVSPVLPT
jgi:hypothetical protein